MSLRTFATSPDERVIAGVCAGIAQTLGVDATLVRLVFALLALAGGAGILLYLALWAWAEGKRVWVAAALAFVAGTPYSILDYRNFLEGLRFDSVHLMAGHGEMLGRGWIYHLMFSLRYGLGTPLLLAAIVGMGVLFVKSWRTALLICTFRTLNDMMPHLGQTPLSDLKFVSLGSV